MIVACFQLENNSSTASPSRARTNPRWQMPRSVTPTRHFAEGRRVQAIANGEARAPALVLARRHCLGRDEQVMQPAGARESGLDRGLQQIGGSIQQVPGALPGDKLQKALGTDAGPMREKALEVELTHAHGARQPLSARADAWRVHQRTAMPSRQVHIPCSIARSSSSQAFIGASSSGYAGHSRRLSTRQATRILLNLPRRVPREHTQPAPSRAIRLRLAHTASSLESMLMIIFLVVPPSPSPAKQKDTPGRAFLTTSIRCLKQPFHSARATENPAETRSPRPPCVTRRRVLFGESHRSPLGPRCSQRLSWKGEGSP